MGYKVFISYKYADDDVNPLGSTYKRTARGYVDYLQNNEFGKENVNKGEKDDEDLSQFKDNTIKTHLKEKIWDSSITIVLISPNMFNHFIYEGDQWIPWEISYSLRTQTRKDRVSNPNALISVVLPNRLNSYEYFINEHKYGYNKSFDMLNVDCTFNIIKKNYFNRIGATPRVIDGHNVYNSEDSYIPVVKWDTFLSNMDLYLNEAINRRNHFEDYNITIRVDGND